MGQENETVLCVSCAKPVHELAVFPGGRCLSCHAARPEVKRQAANMTGEKLAAMFSGKRAAKAGA